MLRRLEVRPLFTGQEPRITTALVALPTATPALLLFVSQGATEEPLVALARPEGRGCFIEARQVGGSLLICCAQGHHFGRQADRLTEQSVAAARTHSGQPLPP